MNENLPFMGVLTRPGDPDGSWHLEVFSKEGISIENNFGPSPGKLDWDGVKKWAFEQLGSLKLTPQGGWTSYDNDQTLKTSVVLEYKDEA